MSKSIEVTNQQILCYYVNPEYHKNAQSVQEYQGSKDIDEIGRYDRITAYEFDFIQEQVVVEEAQMIEQGQTPRYATAAQRLFVLTRDGGACFYCKVPIFGPRRMQADHVKPATLGGLTLVSNLVCTCKACNWAKWRMPKEDFVQRLSQPDGLAWRDQQYTYALQDMHRQI